MVESELLSTEIFLSKVTPKIAQEKYLLLIYLLLSVKTSFWMYRIKDSNGEKIIGSFYEKELLLSKL